MLLNSREFFSRLVADHLDISKVGTRLDFLATYAAENRDGAIMAKELETMLGCQVTIANAGLPGNYCQCRVAR